MSGRRTKKEEKRSFLGVNIGKRSAKGKDFRVIHSNISSVVCLLVTVFLCYIYTLVEYTKFCTN